MSEVRPVPVLWQLAGTHGPPYWTGETCDALKLLQDSGLLVPVELCKHGYIDGHMVTHFNTARWCPGADIGGDDEPISLDDYEREILDRALDKMEGIGGDDDA